MSRGLGDVYKRQLWGRLPTHRVDGVVVEPAAGIEREVTGIADPLWGILGLFVAVVVDPIADQLVEVGRAFGVGVVAVDAAVCAVQVFVYRVETARVAVVVYSVAGHLGDQR